MSHYIAGVAGGQEGWLAGWRDPQLGKALWLVHAQPAKDWSAEGLAEEVGLSRSGFAARFGALVGKAPMQYLTYWRMQLAARRLRKSREAMAQIGYAVGFRGDDGDAENRRCDDRGGARG